MPLFVLLTASPNQRIKAVGIGIMVGLIWSKTEYGPLAGAIGAVVGTVVVLVGGTIATRVRARLSSMTRRGRMPLVALLTVVEPGQSVLFLVPAVLLADGYFASRGTNPADARLMIVAGLGLYAFLAIRQLRKSLPSPIDA